MILSHSPKQNRILVLTPNRFCCLIHEHTVGEGIYEPDIRITQPRSELVLSDRQQGSYPPRYRCLLGMRMVWTLP